MEKKIKISVLTIIIFAIIIALDLSELNDHSNIKLINHHFFISLFFALYNLLLFFSLIILKSEMFGKKYKITRLFIPFCNIILNLIIFILIYNNNDDLPCSLFFLYELVFSVFFDTEYQECFIFYTAKCIFFLILFIIKYFLISLKYIL